MAKLVESDASVQVGFLGKWPDFLDEVKELLSLGRRIVVLAGNKERQQVLKAWLSDQGCPLAVEDSLLTPPRQGVVSLSLGSGENGFVCEAIGLSLFTETEIYGKPKVRSRPRKKRPIALDWKELSPGDYVVHVNHGIGQFMGLCTMTVDGATRDFLHIRYADNDALYVPTDQVHMVQKYLGPDGKPPALQRLGGGDWQRVKARTKKAVEDMARKLLLLEAKRKSRRGYAFSPDTPWQAQFEEAFEYEDTEDQAHATLEIKKDMESYVPMDRILCGDVGFGKTEVAMRCAFKAVMDSKQVAVLVPTTILAEQHFTTFTRRFAGYPVVIDVLSRFRSPQEQREILRKLAEGSIDIIIGTHRLLSKDVKFHDLGLVIIDEEHRFGVAQKERLKELAETSDVLTLTATPIPRTLNMALSGIRDISVIETPPEGRFPVETYVLPYTPSVIGQAIRRELRRGGQVFYVSNRIYSIGRVYQRVQGLVPEARIAVAHGRMREEELSRTMRDFLQGRYDILVSTTIIESGLDMPNVNTLIVEDADRLGLAQLYQLRGRVGRSNRIAYAYFTYRPDRNLTIEAEERLNALRDFAKLGSGMSLAMRDMEIRGAGNLLGPEQHGFMALVGYDLYLSLLEEAVRALKGEREEKPQRLAAAVDIPCDAFLPGNYVESSKERFALYRRLAAAEDPVEVDNLEAELEDRYGELPKPALNLLDVARLRILAGQLGITQVSLVRGDVVMGRDVVLFRVQVPELFPVGKLARIPPRIGQLSFDPSTATVTLSLGRVSPEEALGKALRVVAWLGGE